MLYAYYRIHSMVQNMINLMKEHNINFFKKKQVIMINTTVSQSVKQSYPMRKPSYIYMYISSHCYLHISKVKYQNSTRQIFNRFTETR